MNGSEAIADRIVLPAAPKPLGQYVAVSEARGLAFLSGMLPIRDGAMVFTGYLDKEKGRDAARLAGLNALAVLKEHYGSFERIERVVQVAVYIAAASDFQDHAFVADGCSELLNQFFPGKHTRLVFGVSSLPMNASVELALMVQMRARAIDPDKSGG